MPFRPPKPNGDARSNPTPKTRNPLPIEERRRAEITQTFTAFSGPIPDPEFMGRYESVKVGWGDRIFAMAEKSQQDEAKLANRALLINGLSHLGGLVSGFLIVLVMMAGGIYLLSLGHTLDGWFTMCSGIATLVMSAIWRQATGKK